MEAVYNFSINELVAFGLILVRMVAFVVAMPVIGTANIPIQIKILFTLSMSAILYPSLGWQEMAIAVDSLNLITLIAKEAFVGLSLGYVARFFFFAITMAGQVVSISMGLASAQLFNPSMGETSSAFDQFFGILATLFFLAINGHHFLIGGLVDSFRLVPLTALTVDLTAFGGFGAVVSEAMVIAVKICAPVMISILFMNIAMGIVGRTVPQINVLITALPVNSMVGFIIVIIALPFLVWEMHVILDKTIAHLFGFMRAL